MLEVYLAKKKKKIVFPGGREEQKGPTALTAYKVVGKMKLGLYLKTYVEEIFLNFSHGGKTMSRWQFKLPQVKLIHLFLENSKKIVLLWNVNIK